MNARILLAPVAAIYWCVTAVRNWLFDAGLSRQVSFDKPVVCVGNITVGGTGKTPLVEHLLANLLSRGHHVGVVSRGYRRKSHGLVVATGTPSAAILGDEPCQMKRKFPEADMVVCANRAEAIDVCFRQLACDVVVMDDGMQHRHVRPGFTIMVADYARPMWTDLTLPAGNLREPWRGRLRADVVIVNKCPASLTRQQADAIASRMALAPSQQIFFCAIGYSEQFVSVNSSLVASRDTPVVALAGIGRPEPFFQEVESRVASVTRMAFPDHHDFSAADSEAIRKALDELGPQSCLVLTEKDFMREPFNGQAADFAGHPVLVLPIKLIFLFDSEELFNHKVLDYVDR